MLLAGVVAASLPKVLGNAGTEICHQCCLHQAACTAAIGKSALPSSSSCRSNFSSSAIMISTCVVGHRIVYRKFMLRSKGQQAAACRRSLLEVRTHRVQRVSAHVNKLRLRGDLRSSAMLRTWRCSEAGRFAGW